MAKKKIRTIISLTVTAAVLTGIAFGADKLSVLNKARETENITQPEYITNIFNKNDVMQINIDIDEAKWNDLCENATEEQYYEADVTINGKKYSSVGLRAKGNTSLTNVANDDTTDRYSLKIKFDKYNKNQTFGGLDKLALNNIIQDATYMKEYMSYDMLNSMGVDTPAYEFANITLNGEPWGLYLALEVIDENFIERYFGDCDGNLYKPETVGGGNNKDRDIKQMDEEIEQGDGENGGPREPGGQGANMPQKDGQDQNQEGAPNGQDQGKQGMNQGHGRQEMGQGGGMSRNVGGADLLYSDDEVSSYSTLFGSAKFDWTNESDNKRVIEMIKTLNENPSEVGQYLDVDEVLRYFAVNTFIVNLDSYVSNMKHNYYLYENNGYCTILPWDYNLAFGGFQSGSAANAVNFPIDNPVADNIESSPLIGKLLEVDEYKELYHKYLNQIVEEYINSGKYAGTIDNMNNLIASYVENDATAFYSYDKYKTAIENLKQFGIDRAKSISAQLEGTQPTTTTGNIETSVNLEAMGSQGGGNKDDGNKGGGPGGMMQRPDGEGNNQMMIPPDLGNK